MVNSLTCNSRPCRNHIRRNRHYSSLSRRRNISDRSRHNNQSRSNQSPNRLSQRHRLRLLCVSLYRSSPRHSNQLHLLLL